MQGEKATHEEVKIYYGQTLENSSSLLTNACCVGKSTLTPKQKEVMSIIPEEISSKFYGCGSPVPPCLQGKTIVDLGCGTGVDVYISSYFAKQTGKVIGIDMTPAQLEVAKKHLPQVMEKFGFKTPNVEFIEAKIQKLPLQDNSVDVVISNCVVNLSPSKEQVFAEIKRVLKPGGQLYFSDVYADRRIPQEYRKDKVLWGQCLSGALYIEDFRRIMSRVGFEDCRIISKSTITVNNKQIEERVKDIKFYSITYRAFNLSNLEDRCQDYGQSATYNGGILQFEQQFKLDNGHIFKKGKKEQVCGNTAAMLQDTRYGPFFTVDPRKQHQGLFDCSKGGDQQNSCEGSGCC